MTDRMSQSTTLIWFVGMQYFVFMTSSLQYSGDVEHFETIKIVLLFFQGWIQVSGEHGVGQDLGL